MQSHAASSRLMVLMFTDVVGSVELKGRLGADAYTGLIARHDRLFRSIVESLDGARVLQDTGDGFLAQFNTSSDGVSAALRFQAALHAPEWESQRLKVRVGLNVGQVTEVRDPQSGTTKFIGLATDMTARVMGLAEGGQILLTRSIFDDARQYVREHPRTDHADTVHELRWIAHGAYLLKGNPEPIEVYEVGAEGIAPLKAPADSEKARRSVAAEDEETLGWRPAAGLEVPRRKGWHLTEKLGEGGFGEVWLGKHNRTKDQRVFKFCFDSDRLRSFKRELTLFRLMREALGDRKDIARLYEVQLEAPPYFLESEFSGYGNLAEWAEKQGGIATLPLETRIDLVARSAEAVAGAHSVGVLHKDIKPSNILMYMSEDGGPRPRLADFGIGMVIDRAQLEGRQITITGMTEDILADNASSRTGTRMYAPPESLTGAPFTIQGDVYALGVMLYQMAVGDLGRPLATGWQSEIPDPLLVEDITACVAGDRDRRLGSAKELADRLRALPARRAARRRRRLMRTGLAAGAAAAVVAVVAGAWAVRERGLRHRAETAEVAAVAAQKEEAAQRARAEELATSIRTTATDFILDYDKQIEPLEGSTPARRVLVQAAVRFLEKIGSLDPSNADLQRDVARGMLQLADVRGGTRTGSAGETEEAIALYTQTIERFEKLLKGADSDAPTHQAIAVARVKLADVLGSANRRDEAMEQVRGAIGSAEKAVAMAGADARTKGLAQRALASAYLKHSDFLRAVGRTDESAAALEASMSLRRAAVAADPTDATAQRDLTVGLLREAEVLKLDGKSEEALAPLREVLGIREKLAAGDNPSAREQRDVANGHYELADALNRIGKSQNAAARGSGAAKLGEAKSHARTAAERFAVLADADPTNARLMQDVTKSELLLADVIATLGENVEAEKLYKGVLARAQAQPTRSAAQFRSTVGMTHHQLAELYRDTDRRTDAASEFRAAIAVWDDILRQDPESAQAKKWRDSAVTQLGKLGLAP